MHTDLPPMNAATGPDDALASGRTAVSSDGQHCEGRP